MIINYNYYKLIFIITDACDDVWAMPGPKDALIWDTSHARRAKAHAHTQQQRKVHGWRRV